MHEKEKQIHNVEWPSLCAEYILLGILLMLHKQNKTKNIIVMLQLVSDGANVNV